MPNNSGVNITIVDCEDDVLLKNISNVPALKTGYPINYAGDNNGYIYHTNNLVESNVQWSGELVTLYTDNYLRWYHGENVRKVLKTRMEIAQNSITQVVKAAPSIAFGLQIFNFGNGDGLYNANGGRIVFNIQNMANGGEAKFLNLVNNQLVARTWTPLCETLYEAQQFFAGKNVDFGDDDRQFGRYLPNQPPRDQSAEGNGKYISPFNSCTSKAFVILITDGVPYYDHAADNKIAALSSIENGKTVHFSGTTFNLPPYGNNYLAALAQWMNDHDVNSHLEGKQTVETYTIGFSEGADDAAPLLKETAKLGGGKYFRAEDSVQLTSALLNALESLKPSNDSLTSASVAANSFDRTQTLNSVYYAMFQPDNSPRWQGNLKKYKAVSYTHLTLPTTPYV